MEEDLVLVVAVLSVTLPPDLSLSLLLASSFLSPLPSAFCALTVFLFCQSLRLLCFSPSSFFPLLFSFSSLSSILSSSASFFQFVFSFRLSHLLSLALNLCFLNYSFSCVFHFQTHLPTHSSSHLYLIFPSHLLSLLNISFSPSPLLSNSHSFHPHSSLSFSYFPYSLLCSYFPLYLPLIYPSLIPASLDNKFYD